MARLLSELPVAVPDDLPDKARVLDAFYIPTRYPNGHPDLRAVGYFGSYARGDQGPGSDLDVVAIVESSGLPFDRRSVEWDTTQIAVPVDLLVYTQPEYDSLLASDTRFASVMRRETVWFRPDRRGS